VDDVVARRKTTAVLRSVSDRENGMAAGAIRDLCRLAARMDVFVRQPSGKCVVRSCVLRTSTLKNFDRAKEAVKPVVDAGIHRVQPVGGHAAANPKACRKTLCTPEKRVTAIACGGAPADDAPGLAEACYAKPLASCNSSQRASELLDRQQAKRIPREDAGAATLART
jgi:hypothetical protein